MAGVRALLTAAHAGKALAFQVTSRQKTENSQAKRIIFHDQNLDKSSFYLLASSLDSSRAPGLALLNAEAKATELISQPLSSLIAMSL